MSNYVLTTSNLISKRITDLRTDMITEDITASNKFIVNNLYNDDLILNGTLTINSNLIVLGDTTQLDTIVYTTERLEIVNANNTTTALMVQQNTAGRDIFVASNVNTAVFKIANNGDVFINGDVGIGTTQPRSKLDVIGNMTISGNVIPSSNTFYNLGSPSRKWKDLYLSGNSIFLNNTVLSSDAGADLSIKDTNGSFKNMNINSLQVIGDIHILGDGNYKKKGRDVILDTSNYVLTTSNNLINYVLASSNTLINKANFNDANMSNYVFATSNNLINYVLASSNTLINKANFNDTNMSNYVFTTSNNLINYVLASSNTLINKANFNDTNMSNYVFTTSNNLINYVLASSNTLINKANFNDTNMSCLLYTSPSPRD